MCELVGEGEGKGKGWGVGGGYKQVTVRGEEPVADSQHHQAERSRSLTAN